MEDEHWIKKKIFPLCFQDLATVTPGKLYTRKEFVRMETSIAYLQKSFFTTAIQ